MKNKRHRRNFRNCPWQSVWLSSIPLIRERNISIESIRRQATLTIIVNIMRPVDNPDRDQFKRVSWHASIISADISALHGTTENFYYLTSWFNFCAVLDFYIIFSNNFVIIFRYYNELYIIPKIDVTWFLLDRVKRR